MDRSYEEIMFDFDENTSHDFSDEARDIVKMVEKRERSVLNKFTDEVGISDSFGYEFTAHPTSNSELKYVLTIFTTKPGVWIGPRGSNISILKKMLLEEFMHEFEIKFTEVHGGFINKEEV